jgi:hypothetical protein
MSTTGGISNMRAASVPKVASGASPTVSAQQKISNLFPADRFKSGTGRITKAQFEQAFSKLNLPASVKGIGLEAAFSKLDPSGTGVVSKKDFIQGMQSMMASKNSHPQKYCFRPKPRQHRLAKTTPSNVLWHQVNAPNKTPAPSPVGWSDWEHDQHFGLTKSALLFFLTLCQI